MSLSEIIEIHQDQIERYGGSAGLRDLELLKSALGMPSTTYRGEFLNSNLFEMAAAYLFHIVNNHPYVDGNKRTGIVSALIFLELNGCSFEAPENDLAEVVLHVAEGKIDKAAISQFFKKWAAWN